MLFMAPIALALRKKLKGVFVTLILVGLIIVALVACGLATHWALPQNFVYDLRAWGEMCVGMFAYYLAATSKDRQECVDAFENAKIFDGKTIFEAEKDIEVIYG